MLNVFNSYVIIAIIISNQQHLSVSTEQLKKPRKIIKMLQHEEKQRKAMIRKRRREQGQECEQVSLKLPRDLLLIFMDIMKIED